MYDLYANIQNLQYLQSLAELTLDQSQQLQDLIQNLNFQKVSFNTHLSNNIQPMEILAGENVAASRFLFQIPANVFRVSAF